MQYAYLHYAIVVVVVDDATPKNMSNNNSWIRLNEVVIIKKMLCAIYTHQQ